MATHCRRIIMRREIGEASFAAKARAGWWLCPSGEHYRTTRIPNNFQRANRMATKEICFCGEIGAHGQPD
ncbi:MAG: hypothetical protein B7Y47_02340 [Sphingomonas sp. 28-63-12]|nr:MAG: hypothetical protein B7Y47_02340 [Sphingomonas sp. 28-63-12]